MRYTCAIGAVGVVEESVTRVVEPSPQSMVTGTVSGVPEISATESIVDESEPMAEADAVISHKAIERSAGADGRGDAVRARVGGGDRQHGRRRGIDERRAIGHRERAVGIDGIAPFGLPAVIA